MMIFLCVHALATIYMTGVIWFVQLVHYPLLGRIGPAHFEQYHQAHTARTGWVVGPPMLIELTCSIGLAVSPPGDLGHLLPALGLVLLSLIWVTTALFSVRYHRRLSGGFTNSAHRLLVRTNWIRTILWSIRSILALYFLLRISAS